MLKEIITILGLLLSIVLTLLQIRVILSKRKQKVKRLIK